MVGYVAGSERWAGIINFSFVPEPPKQIKIDGKKFQVQF